MRITVYDFDDTLFCSTYFIGLVQEVKQRIPISDLLLGQIPKELIFEKLALSILELLKVSAENSDKVMIITNATKDWVEGIFYEHLPGCDGIPKNMEIVSCFSQNIQDISSWKVKGFEETLGTYFQSGNHELISIGDSTRDRTAALTIKEKYPNVVVKHVKLCDLPSMEDILNQHTAIRLYFPILAQKPDPCDECLVKISEHRYFVDVFRDSFPSMFGAPIVLGSDEIPGAPVEISGVSC